jgi:hypothetical protein
MTEPQENDVFSSARSKLKWADEHFAKLNETLKAFYSSAYQVMVQDDPKTGRRTYDMVIKRELPDSVPFLIGDVVHNLRSALDHVAYEIVKRSGRPPSQGLVFPIKDTRKEVIDAIKSEIQVAAGSELVTLIVDRIQPHEGGNGHALWVLHRLDCIDKHRELLPAVDSLAFEHIQAVDEHGTTYTGLVLKWVRGGNLALPDYVKGKKLHIQHEGRLTVGIQFKNVDCAEGELVIPTLNRLRSTVAKTVDQITTAYRSHKSSLSQVYKSEFS